MMIMRLALGLLLLSSAPVLAQGTPGMANMPTVQAPTRETPSTEAYRGAMMKMHQGMEIPYTGDADRDFVAGMIPHHQGAVDMARVELQYGKDPALRRLAQQIIASQQKEITFMRQWEAQHGH